MDGKKRKQKGERKRSRRYAVILPYLLVMALFLSAFGERLITAGQISSEIRRSEAVLADVSGQKAALEAEFALAEDPDALEADMRRLGYIYPGETVYLKVGAH